MLQLVQIDLKTVNKGNTLMTKYLLYNVGFYFKPTLKEKLLIFFQSILTKRKCVPYLPGSYYF